MSAAEFEDQAGKFKEYILQLPGCANIFNGVALPTCAPRSRTRSLGKSLESLLLSAVERSYLAQFPAQSFKNLYEGKLSRKVTVVDESRYSSFLGRLETSPLVWWHFPGALQGFGIEADREQMATLPQDFVLTGPVSSSFAFMMYPDVLGRDNMTPVSDLAAVQWRSPEISLCLGLRGDDLILCGRNLGAYDNFSGGVLVLRQRQS